jgi:hypothetical protein
LPDGALTSPSWWALEDLTSDLLRIKEGMRDALTCVFAREAVSEMSQEFRLVPPSSVAP